MARVPYNKLLTNLTSSSRTEEYWPSVVFIRTSLRSVCTATTSGQYYPVRPSRSVSKRLVCTFRAPLELCRVQAMQRVRCELQIPKPLYLIKAYFQTIPRILSSNELSNFSRILNVNIRITFGVSFESYMSEGICLRQLL